MIFLYLISVILLPSSTHSQTLTDCLTKHGQSLHLTDIPSLSNQQAKEYVRLLLFGKNKKYEEFSEEELITMCDPGLPSSTMSFPVYQLKYQDNCTQSGKAE